MLQRLGLIFAFGFCAMVISLAYASVYNTAEELFNKSGIETHIQAIPMSVLVGFEASINHASHLRKLSDQETRRYKKLIRDSYDADRLKKVITDYIVQELNEAEMNEALKWLNTPLGRKITRLEMDVVGKDTSLEMMQYVQSLEKSPPQQDFFRQVEKLAVELNVEQVAVDLAMNSQMAITLAMATVEPNTTEEQLQYIKKELERSRSLVKAVVQQDIMTNLMFTYRTISVDELKQYIDFSTSEKGRKYQIAMARALTKAATLGSSELSAKMIDILKSKSVPG